MVKENWYPLINRYLAPPTIYSVPIVATKSGISKYTTKIPLITPTTRQAAIAIRIASHWFIPPSTTSADMIIPAKPATRPVEISTWPTIRGKLAPRAVKAIKVSWVNMAEKFPTDKKSGRINVVTTMIPTKGRNTPNSSVPKTDRSLEKPAPFTACSFIPFTPFLSD